MSSLVLTGDTSGQVTLAAPAVAGSNTITLQAATATMSVNTLATAVASTSGTSIDFTSIPSWVKRVTVMFNGVSTSGTSYKQIRFTDSALKTSGYSSTSSLIYGANLCAVASATTGFFIRSDTATEALDGCYVFNLLNASTFLWSGFGNVSDSSSARTWQQSGVVTMASALTAVRITTVNGTDTFDAGTINILYEG